jgi:hypothetical protein
MNQRFGLESMSDRKKYHAPWVCLCLTFLLILVFRIPLSIADVDWRAKGAVTPVKNQGSTSPCDVSWAFAATGAVEGEEQIRTGILRNLSEQQLLDCEVLSTILCKFDKGANWAAPFLWDLTSKSTPSLTI